jgi:hypothetical protein
LRSHQTEISSHGAIFWALQLQEISPEIAELLELLNARERFDEISALLEQSPRSLHQYSEEERNLLVARAASMMSKGSS